MMEAGEASGGGTPVGGGAGSGPAGPPMAVGGAGGAPPPGLRPDQWRKLLHGCADLALGACGVAGAVMDSWPGAGSGLPADAADAPSATVAQEDAAITQSVGDLRAAGLKDAHHVIQDAAVRDLPGYDTNAAPGVQLEGPSTAPGTPHYNATQVQRLPGGGTYGAERQIGYDALRAAGYTDAEATQALEEADEYFGGIGVDEQTPTRIPGNR
ncbi:MAG: hypothetical protein ABSG86_16980 [Thermoguttaceae bacterium]